MNSNFEITLAKTPEKTKSIDDKSMEKVSFQTYLYNSEKSNDSEIIFTTTSKIINNYLYGIIYIIVSLLLFKLFEILEWNSKFISILAQCLLMSSMITFVGLVLIPFTMMKNIIFKKDGNKYFVQEQSVLGFKNDVLDFEKVKKVITKVDKKNNYITFRSGNVLSQSIIIKIESDNSWAIKEANDFLIKFTEAKYPNIEYSKI